MILELLILDPSVVIAILYDVRHLNIMEAVLSTHKDLAVPRSVYREVSRGTAGSELERLIAEGKIRVTSAVSEHEISAFKKETPKLNEGEIDVILTYEKASDTGGAYCAIDDEDARKVAESMNIRFTGTMGLLCTMRDKGVISRDKFGAAINALRKAGFRMPRDIC